MSLTNSIQNLNISIQYEANRSKKGVESHDYVFKTNEKYSKLYWS